MNKCENILNNKIIIYNKYVNPEHAFCDKYYYDTITFTLHVSDLPKALKINTYEDFERFVVYLFDLRRYETQFTYNKYDEIINDDNLYVTNCRSYQDFEELWDIWKKIFGPAILLLNNIKSNCNTLE
jgi:hypothetical protein